MPKAVAALSDECTVAYPGNHGLHAFRLASAKRRIEPGCVLCESLYSAAPFGISKADTFCDIPDPLILGNIPAAWFKYSILCILALGLSEEGSEEAQDQLGLPGVRAAHVLLCGIQTHTACPPSHYASL